MPWSLEIEMSVILTLHSWPLPIESSLSPLKSMMCTTFTLFFFKISSVFTDSKNKKWEFFGKSIPRRSIFHFPSFTQMLSKDVLQSSHSNPSHMNEVKWVPSLTCFFWSSQFLRQERWMYFIVPEHLQGEMSWPSGSSSSSPRHILHVVPFSILPSYLSRISSRESLLFFFLFSLFSFSFLSPTSIVPWVLDSDMMSSLV